jgi:hypothetical protein
MNAHLAVITLGVRELRRVEAAGLSRVQDELNPHAAWTAP